MENRRFTWSMICVLFILAFIALTIRCNRVEKALRQPGKSELSVDISHKYLNLPVSQSVERSGIRFVADGIPDLSMVIRLAPAKPDYWVFLDVTAYKGKNLKILYDGDPEGLAKIYQDDVIAGNDSLYSEKNRPQFHFTTRRGWNNDPNGLVYLDGEYHLFYQHNPLEREWENMSWGHAVSSDLVHWKELPTALLPDTLGTIFSGSAVIDRNNCSGFGIDALVAFYTSAGRTMKQCIAYSTDRGRSFVKYAGNPVLGPDRDPKVFWYEPSKSWVLVLYNDNYNAVYNSKDLRTWEYKSKVMGFYECPELFELPVDGNPMKKKWVMYGGSGTYMTGTFNGEEFHPEHGKYFYTWGSQYAAQTYNNIPDGRRIQVGWGRIEQKGMPFNQMMLFPCELTLRTSPDGVRLYCNPVKEVEELHERSFVFSDITAEDVNRELAGINGDLFHLKADIEIVHGLGFSFKFRGNRILDYDGNFGRFNGAPYTGDYPGSLRFNVELLIDRTSFEAYIDNGKLFLPEGLKDPATGEGIEILGDVMIHQLELYEMKSIW
jgi:fructan beta-fructosidase